MKTTLTPTRIFRATARLMSLLLLWVWGSLFIEHLAWFTPPMPIPPFFVWFGQIIHLLLLGSYILGFWKERAGSLGMVIFSFVFFFLVVGNASAIVFFLLSSLPAGLYAICWRLKSRKKKYKNNGKE